MVQNNSILVIDTQITLNTKNQIGRLVQVEGKKRIEHKIFSGDIQFPIEMDKTFHHDGVLITPGRVKKKITNLQNGKIGSMFKKGKLQFL